jgi:hypothetical protein
MSLQPCGCEPQKNFTCDWHYIEKLELLVRNLNEELQKLKDGQPRAYSVYESVVNVIVGYLIALMSNMIILPLMGFPVSTKEASIIGFWFTLVSVVRSYIMRRLFNTLHVRS